MKLSELNALLQDTSQWSFMGKGGYNTVYLSVSEFQIDGHDFYGQWVLKLPDYTSCEKGTDLFQDGHRQKMNNAERAVRKWNEVNPDYPAIQIGRHWIAPYLGETPASDIEIANKILEIFRRTRNVVFDLMGKGNCLNFNGEIICVDVDLTLRRGSIASDYFLDRFHGSDDHAGYAYLEDYEKRKPMSVGLVLDLMYLMEHIDPAEINEAYLTTDMVNLLRPFRLSGFVITVALLETLASLDSALMSPIDKVLAVLDKLTLQADLIHELCLFCIEDPASFTETQLERLIGHIQQNRGYLNRAGASGYNLLQTAIIHSNLAVVDLLLNNVADVNAVVAADKVRFSGLSPLEIAGKIGDVSTSKRVLEALPNMPSVKEGESHVIHFAAVYGMTDVIRHILDTVGFEPSSLITTYWRNTVGFFNPHLADNDRRLDVVNALDEEGRTPLDWALTHNQTETVQMLRSEGGYAAKNFIASQMSTDLNQTSTAPSLDMTASGAR